MEYLNKLLKSFGTARIIIVLFLTTLLIVALAVGISPIGLLSDSLVRLGMNGVLVLAMVPAILCGIGPNFGLPLGIVCGLVGALVAIELKLVGFVAIFGAMLVALPLAAIVGLGYGILLNRVKGSEMMIATYVGFSTVFFMCIGWLVLPFKSPESSWFIGGGLRVTVSIQERMGKYLNNLLSFNLGKLEIPTGLLLFFLILCGLMWLFLRSKAGMSMKASGINPRFAAASGINVNKNRLIGTMISTILGAIGIIVYAQSFTYLQLYRAPMYMGFHAVAAILIGGATVKTAKISHVILGTFLFQGLLVVSLPVANKIIAQGNLAEITRIIVSNGVILYALTQARKGSVKS